MNNYKTKGMILNKASTALFLLATLTFTSSAKSQQVLLDANGVPLSDEVLLLLSSTSNKLSPKNNKTEKEDSAKDTTEKAVSKKRKFLSDPLLEQELFDSLKAGQTARAQHLLKMGVKPVYKNEKGETPLGIAVTRGWASMVVQLLDNDADLHEKGARGVTLLHKASAHGLTDVAKLLVRKGLNPGKRTDKNWTPLHIAARYGHWQLVQYFIQAGVDPDIRNSDGKTALGLARHLRHMGIIKILAPVTSVRSLDMVSKKSRKKKRRSKKRKN